MIYAFRVVRLPLLDAGGSEIGKIVDIVLVPGRPGTPPRLVGFVATSQRRKIFVNSARVATVDNDGVRLRSWDVDLHPFKRRPGEKLIAAALHREVVFEVDSYDVAARSGWSVNVVGTAEEIVHPDELARVGALDLQSWAGEVRDRFVRIRATEVSGRQIRPTADATPGTT